MDTLGEQNGAGLNGSKIAEPEHIPPGFHRLPPTGSQQPDIDLLCPRLLIQLLTSEQIQELLSACVGRPSNPFVEPAQHRVAQRSVFASPARHGPRRRA